MGRILLFTTGGTIATVAAAGDRSRAPKLGGEEVAGLLPEGAAGRRDIEVVELGLVPSTAVTPRLAFDWACEVERRLSDADARGAVVTMGTNAMEEAAYLLDLKLDGGKPVVVTGSMKLPGEPLSDAGRNLAAAVAAARDPRLAGAGVVVVMNDEVHLAREVTKADSRALDAFVSPGVGPLGRFLDRGGRAGPELRIGRHVAAAARMPAAGLEENVGYVKVVLGGDGLLIDALVDHGAHGIVIEATGEGSATEAMAPAIERAIGAGVVIVVASRALTGGTLPQYTERGESRWLADRGALFAGRLSGPKARIRLMFALSSDVRPQTWFPEDA
ncbi:MAG: asparaginase [Parvibaculaceae bacterium]